MRLKAVEGQIIYPRFPAFPTFSLFPAADASGIFQAKYFSIQLQNIGLAVAN